MPPDRDSMDLRKVIETIPALVLCALPDGTVEFVNRAWQEYTGRSLQRLTDSGWRSIVHGDDLAKFLDEWNIAFLARRPFETEARIQRSDGQYHWFLIKKALAVSGTRNGQPSLRTLVAFEDINDRKQSQIKLQQSEARYRLLIEAASDAVVSVGENSAIQFVNSATMTVFGYEPKELIGKPLTVLMPEFMQTQHENGFRRYLATGQRHVNWQGTELSGLRKNGQEFPVEVSFGEIITESGRIFTGFIRDVSARKRAEENLRRSEQRWRAVFENSAIGVALTDMTGRFVATNSAYQQMLGYSEEELKKMTFLELTLEDDRQRDWALVTELTDGKRSQFQIEKRYRRKDGRLIWVSNNVSLVPGMEELPQLVMALSEDITGRKQAEEERERLRRLQADLAHVTRVSTMGELTVSLAHEIKQPIVAAVTNAEACLRLMDHHEPNLPQAREAALEMIKDARRAAEIIDRVRSLYQRGCTQLELVDVNGTIAEMRTILRNEATRHSVTIRTDLGDGVPKVMADRVQLQQVVMNLMLNGVEAMKDNGGELSIKSQLSEGGELLISVADDGVGLPADGADQIFNAFFTTKPQGIGLGLAITRSIVESHGGHVWATANPQRGTTFHFTLPIRTAGSV